MAMLNPIEQFLSINQTIKDLEQQRRKVLDDLLPTVTTLIRNKMDWVKEDVHVNSFDWDLISKHVKMDVTWNKDGGARYVFTILFEPSLEVPKVCLDFREDFNKY